jgi:hypothetical protein
MGWFAGVVQSLAGLFLIALVLWDIFQTVVLPRPAHTRVRLARTLIRLTWPLWRRRAVRKVTNVDQEKILGSYAPAVVLILLMTWMALMILGFGLIVYALRDELTPIPDFGSALYFSGESVLTIGFGDFSATGGLSRLAAVLGGGLGLGVLALGITYLFSLYASFQRRETLVVRLEPRAGAPPSGVALLEAYGAQDMRSALPAFFLEWEVWAAEVLDTHVAYPILPYFRSSHDNASWVSALGAVLDASALVLTCVVDGPTGEATMVQRIGGHVVEDLATFFGWGQTPVALVERTEFDEARQRLADAGWTLRDVDTAWDRFVTLRSGYAARLNEMALYWVTPPALWIGDRGAVRHLPAPPAPPT